MQSPCIRQKLQAIIKVSGVDSSTHVEHVKQFKEAECCCRTRILCCCGPPPNVKKLVCGALGIGAVTEPNIHEVNPIVMQDSHLNGIRRVSAEAAVGMAKLNMVS